MSTNLPEKQESEVRYTIDGREIVLSPSLIRKYLVRGHGELATAQEIALVMGICRARALDPWAAEVYAIKYTANDPMAVVISIDSVRARARSQSDCEGWDTGIIVQDKDGKVKDTAGLILEGEKLLGGWATCQPKDWSKPMRLEVNLNAYIKKKNDGQITKFWKPEQQPMMISKVAEMQLLRRLWPAALSKMYLQEEVGISDLGEGMSIDMAPGTAGNGAGGTWEQQDGQPEPEPILDQFTRLATENGITDLKGFSDFTKAVADAMKKTYDEMMTMACGDFPAYLKAYHKNLAKKQAKEKAAAEAKKAKKAETANAVEKAGPAGTELRAKAEEPGPFPEEGEQINKETGEVFPGPFSEEVQDNRPDRTFIVCSARQGDKMSLGFCRSNCPTFMDCKECKPQG